MWGFDPPLRHHFAKSYGTGPTCADPTSFCPSLPVNHATNSVPSVPFDSGFARRGAALGQGHYTAEQQRDEPREIQEMVKILH